MRKVSLACFILITFGFGASADDALVSPCFDCHGKNGVSTESDVPTAFFVEDSLFIFRDGDRDCGPFEFKAGDTSRPAKDHCEIANELSDDDLTTIAEFFAGEAFVSQAQTTDPALVAKGKEIHDADCEKCHTEGGSVQDDDAGILAGQWMPYLQKSMDDYMSGSRYQDKKMKEKTEKLSAEDIEALVHYYGSLGG